MTTNQDQCSPSPLELFKKMKKAELLEKVQHFHSLAATASRESIADKLDVKNKNNDNTRLEKINSERYQRIKDLEKCLRSSTRRARDLLDRVESEKGGQPIYDQGGYNIIGESKPIDTDYKSLFCELAGFVHGVAETVES